jgi:hypothetical protein
MVRQPAVGPRPPYGVRPQNLQERLMPHAQFEAWEKSETRPAQERYDKDNPQEEAAPIKTRIGKTTVDIFKRVLLFSQGVPEALYDDQMVTTLVVTRNLTDNIIKELCRAIRKPGGDGPGHQISELSLTCLKLFAFWEGTCDGPQEESMTGLTQPRQV